MACTHLLVSIQPLQLWIRYYHPHFLFHTDFHALICFIITATTQKPLWQRYEERNIVWSNIETVYHLKLQ